MYYQNYEDYMRAVLGYANNEPNYTYDSYYPIQMECVKEQISLILGKEYKSFDKAVRDFQDAKNLNDKDGLYDLETSYLLQGLMYDLRMEKENSVIELAKEI